MKPFSELSGAELYWMQPTLKRNFEMRAEDDLYATLMFETVFGSLATAKSSAGIWTFKRVGFFKPWVTVRVRGEESNLMVYYPERAGAEGVLEFSDGETYVWKLANFWATQYQIVSAEGNTLISYTSKISNPTDLIKDQARVDIAPEVQDNDKLALLLLIGWYLIVLQQEDVMATATAVATKVMERK
jgi:hypothetical protein